jgi:hypothetical protein
MLDVHHPYGKVGALPWMGQAGVISYGVTPNVMQLLDISAQIRTFNKGNDPSASDINAIRTAVNSAQRLVFLGFAFHRLNLVLLFSGLPPEHQSKTQSVYATAVGLSSSDSQQIRHELFNLENSLMTVSIFEWI